MVSSRSAVVTTDATICDPDGAGGFFLPLSQGEREMNKKTRGIIYLITLLYVFMGVGVVADFFMSAIETITAKKRRVINKKTGRLVTVLVWNETVANLTLLALGSSAPEILLSCLEIMGAGFKSGELGPSTIVGSAAFNLLVIVAVCIYSIPSPEVRSIKYVSVYHVTVLFSLFAYFWLLVIVKFNSADVIEMWEALMTLALFPALVVTSYAADRGYLEFLSLEQSRQEKTGVAVAALANNSGVVQEEDGSRGFRKQELHPRLRATVTNAKKASNLVPPRKSIAGPRQNQLCADGRLEHMLPAGDHGEGVCDASDNPIQNPAGVLTFREDTMTVNGVAEEKELLVEVLRRNGCSGEVSCRYSTEALSGKPDYDYEEVRRGVLAFADGETHCMVKLKILPKRRFEHADMFQLVLGDPQGGVIFNPNDDGGPDHCVLTVTVKNGLNVRPKGFADQVSRLVETVVDLDSLKFGFSSWRNQIKDAFAVNADDEDEEVDEEDTDLQKMMKGSASQPSPLDYILHVLALPWKFLFAVLAPPSHWANGWVLFCAALFYVGGVTALVADLASMFGCCFEFGDATTAITIVALGTSLPDLFASQTSARNDENADASIVNVTGSNSVNVYLGIGLPWTMAAVYWGQAGANDEWVSTYPDMVTLWPNGAFVVRAGELGFSVTIFSCAAIIALAALRARRLVLKGELGGPSALKLGSSAVLVSLWLLYLGLSIWRINSDAAEVMGMPMMGLAAFSVAGCVCLECALRSAGQRPEAESAEGGRLPQARASRATQARASRVRPSQAGAAAPQQKDDLGSALELGEGPWAAGAEAKAAGPGAAPALLGRGSELRLVQEAEEAVREHERRASRKRESSRGSRATASRASSVRAEGLAGEASANSRGEVREASANSRGEVREAKKRESSRGSRMSSRAGPVMVPDQPEPAAEVSPEQQRIRQLPTEEREAADTLRDEVWKMGKTLEDMASGQQAEAGASQKSLPDGARRSERRSKREAKEQGGKDRKDKKDKKEKPEKKEQKKVGDGKKKPTKSSPLTE